MNNVFVIYASQGAVVAFCICIVVGIISKIFDLGLKYRAYFPIFCCSVFLYITHFPLPNLQTLSCPVASAAPQLHLFNFLEIMQRNFAAHGTVLSVMQSRIFIATALNFMSCFMIGLAFSFANARAVFVAAFAFIFPFLIEISQLTGLFYTFPCAYRQFNVDDILMNFLGIVTGYAALRRFPWRRGLF